MDKQTKLLGAIFITGLILSLACSAGALIVQAPTPTPTRFKTPRATYTFTPDWTATFTPSPTPTSTPTSTFTPTPTPPPTEAPPEEAEAVAPVSAEQPPAPPPPPPNTPTPEEPTATPTPSFPFDVTYYTYNTGSPGQTRMTAWIRVDYAPGIFKTLDGFQMKAIGPNGNTYSSDISGPGSADSTVPGTGDNHRMNAKLEFPPYTPGNYTIYLDEGGVQVSPEIEITLSDDPLQYVHFDFFKSEPRE